MCGIVGIASQKRVADKNWLRAGREAMLHRGPDDAGEWWSEDGRVGFAHRRLAIIDLSIAGHQPMEDSAGQYVIVFNGEIYNYRELREELLAGGCAFKSACDTEVLLEAYKEWGTNCLERIAGAFALGIYDRVKGTLFLARDRAGEKPLFYRHSNERLVFASELKALMADPLLPRRLNLDAFDHYLAYGYVSWDQCILEGMNKLPPGHAALYNPEKDDLRIWGYWRLPDARPSQNFSVDDLSEELQKLLSAAVNRQMVADVPVGILLSGGLDSSLVTALAAGVSRKPVKTFTVSFPGQGKFDEGPYAKLVAEYFKTEHTELIAEPVSVSLLPSLAKQYDEPIADHSIVPTSMLTELVGKSVKVALSGDGGDELFGGYSHYNFLQKIARLRNHIPESIRKGFSLFASHILPVGTKGRNHLIGLGGDTSSSIGAINLYFDAVFRKRLLSPLYRNHLLPAIVPEAKRAKYFDESISVFENAARTDFYTTMVDAYLVKSDRASMLHSLELRAPFLDHKLVEFAFGSVPDSLKATENERKILLRRIGKRLLPPALDLQRKQGFSLPLAAWLKDGWGDFFAGILMDADPSMYDKRMIVKLIEWQRKGFANMERLFALTMFELWRREYRVSI